MRLDDHASQLYICRSVPQIEPLVTRILTAPGRMFGSGNSAKSMPGSGRVFAMVSTLSKVPSVGVDVPSSERFLTENAWKNSLSRL
jgi:hypothetical protein